MQFCEGKRVNVGEGLGTATVPVKLGLLPWLSRGNILEPPFRSNDLALIVVSGCNLPFTLGTSLLDSDGPPVSRVISRQPCRAWNHAGTPRWVLPASRRRTACFLRPGLTCELISTGVRDAFSPERCGSWKGSGPKAGGLLSGKPSSCCSLEGL